VNRIKEAIKRAPVLHRASRRAKSAVGRALGFEAIEEPFFTLSPDVLIAIARVLTIQQQEIIGGRNLIDGHGYYEFGLFRGFSFWFAEQYSRAIAGANLQLYGFDSFEGLPQPEQAFEAATYSKGDLAISYETVTKNLRKWKTDESRIKLFKGFFSVELFSQLRAREKFLPVSICLIDVDLYVSCAPVLEFIKDYLVQGSILLFDDYLHFGEDQASGERRALIDFEACHPSFRTERLFDYGWEGVAFRVLSV
jgi:hypothetical protein